MNASSRIETYTKSKETLQLHKYNDHYGNWAIGWGHTWREGDPETITLAQAEAYFQDDIAIAEVSINTHVKCALLQQEFDCLVSFVENVGTSAFYHSSTLLYLNQGNKIEAASWIPRYSHSGKTAVAGLLIRRIEETCIFLGMPVKNY